MKAFCAKIVNHDVFEKLIIGLILLNGFILGLETSHYIAEHYGFWLELISDLVLLVFYAGSHYENYSRGAKV